MTGLVSLFARSEPQQFQEYFLSWVNAIIGELELNAIALHWWQNNETILWPKWAAKSPIYIHCMVFNSSISL